jgi:Kelch motif
MLSPIALLGVVAALALATGALATTMMLSSAPAASSHPSQVAGVETSPSTPGGDPAPSASSSPSSTPTAPAAASPDPSDEGGDGCGAVTDGATIAGPITPSTLSRPAAGIASGHFGPAGALVKKGGYDKATLLPNGKVFFVGGGSPDTMAELYDPATDKFTQTGSMLEGRHSPLTVLLPNGKVLVAGGTTGGCAVGSIDSVELYDPATGKFTSLGSPMAATMYDTATLLATGKVLFAGGQFMDEAHPDGGASAELFDPSTNKFSPTGTPSQPRLGATVTLLPDHTVLFAGGGAATDPGNNTAELYRPDHGDFVAVGGKMTTARLSASATLLTTGLVLIAGGSTFPSAELYNPATGTFTATGSMTRPRTGQTATLLPGNKVLLTGGMTPTSTNTAEIWSGGTFTATPGSMSVTRTGGTATLLSNGRVLIVSENTAELYQP